MWYYAVGGRSVGPLTLQQMSEELRSGRVTATDLVWTAGMTEWLPAGGVAQLFAPPIPLPMPAGPAPMPLLSAEDSDDRFVRWLLPIGRSGWAIASGYLAFFAFIPLIGPAALATGILGLRDIRRRGVHGMGRAVFGIVLGSLGTVLTLFVLVVALSRR
jgi:hypothetical protein